jgi:hypothetical protein
VKIVSRKVFAVTSATWRDRALPSRSYEHNISGLEQGRRNPTIVSIYELATDLGVSHTELVCPTEGR